MSKTKTKEKKTQSHEALQRQYEEQRRQLLDVTFTLKKVEERVNILTLENNRVQKERELQYLSMNDKIEELTIKNENNEKRLINMRTNLTTAEVENKKLINTIALLQKNTADERAEKYKDMEEFKKNHAFEMAKYENMLSDYKFYMSERDGRMKEINELVEARQLQIANRIREVADKERQKIHATDKIRDQMGNKIRDMRQNLLSLKKEQLETTTRLTMLQNHQLTSQLQYQSKQTEKIVFKNEELESIVLKLRQQLQIHKQVEEQLAKRSHFSKGIIKKLHLRVAQLQSDLQRQKSSIKDESISIKQDGYPSKSQKNERSMILAMQKQLEKSQKKNAELMFKCEQLKKQKDEVSSKSEFFQKNKNQLLSVLLKCFTDIVQDKDKEEGGQRMMNLPVLRGKKVQQWTVEDRKLVISILLTACQPLFNKTNLSIPSLRKIIVYQSQNKQPSFPKLYTERSKQLISHSNEYRLNTNDDVCLLAKEQLSKQKYSTNIASRMVIGKVRDWGKQIPNGSKSSLQRKYKLSVSYRN